MVFDISIECQQYILTQGLTHIGIPPLPRVLSPLSIHQGAKLVRKPLLSGKEGLEHSILVVHTEWGRTSILLFILETLPMHGVLSSDILESPGPSYGDNCRPDAIYKS